MRTHYVEFYENNIMIILNKCIYILIIHHHTLQHLMILAACSVIANRMCSLF